MPERLQKFLARAGVASRRKSEQMIVDGKVTVDGQVITELGSLVDPDKQTVTVDGKRVEVEEITCILLNKPVSYVTTVADPEGRRTVMDLIGGVGVRVYPVGRLDYESSGLLLMTNDGDLTYRLLHPKFHLEKTYRVTVMGMPESHVLKSLQSGIELEDGMTSPARITVLRHHPQESVLEVTIYEGRNRQVRRMFEAIDHPVKRLKRIRFGPLRVDQVASGHWRRLRTGELAALYKSVGLEPPKDAGANMQRQSDATGLRKSRTARGKSTDPSTQPRRSAAKLPSRPVSKDSRHRPPRTTTSKRRPTSRG